MARRLLGMLVVGMVAGCGLASGASPDPSASQTPPRPSPDWVFAMPQCAAYDAAAYPAQQHRVHVLNRGSERVETFAPGWAARSLEDVRQVVAACTRYEYGSHSPGAPGFRESHAIVDSGFAGDESMLVKTDRLELPGKSSTRYTAVVRRGDRVLTLSVAGLGQGAVLSLARDAASHLN
jgi:hypothetical protein